MSATLTKRQRHEIMRLVTEIAEMEWSNGACHNTSWLHIHLVEQTMHSKRCVARIREILGLPPRHWRTSRHIDLRTAERVEREYALGGVST